LTEIGRDLNYLMFS